MFAALEGHRAAEVPWPSYGEIYLEAKRYWRRYFRISKHAWTKRIPLRAAKVIVVIALTLTIN